MNVQQHHYKLTSSFHTCTYRITIEDEQWILKFPSCACACTVLTKKRWENSLQNLLIRWSYYSTRSGCICNGDSGTTSQNSYTRISASHWHRRYYRDDCNPPPSMCPTRPFSGPCHGTCFDSASFQMPAFNPYCVDAWRFRFKIINILNFYV